MNGTRTGRLSLRLDALYCATAALIVGVGANTWSAHAGASVVVLRTLAIVVAIWSALLWLLARRPRLTPSLWLVGTANVVAASTLAACALLVPSALLAVVLTAVAIEVAGFACSQAVALRRIRSSLA